MNQELEMQGCAKPKKERAQKRPLLNFFEIGLTKGDTLIYKENKRITVTIVDGSHVLYNGERMKLTPVTKLIKKTDNSLQPSPFWIDKKSGQLLSKLYGMKYRK